MSPDTHMPQAGPDMGAAGPFSGLRVLDLTSHIAGPYCTKLFADYGADVVKIERPVVGDGARLTPPFFRDEPDLEGSLLFQYLNTNKKSVTLDLKRERGVAIALDLVRDVDVVVESFRPGTLDRLGLGFGQLQAVNPKVVLTSISNFGQTGPYRDLRASELVLYAMGGIMAISGRSDREPLKHGLAQAQYGAGAVAAYATACAVLAQMAGVPGQWVDVSIQETLASELIVNEPTYAWAGGIQGRRPPSGDGLNNIMASKDGYVVLQFAAASTWSSVAELLDHPPLADPKFATAAGRARHAEELDSAIAMRLAQMGKWELFERAHQHRLLSGVAQEPADLYACPQLEGRDYFVDVDHPRSGTLRHPGAPVLMSETPWTLRHRAPLLGEHTPEVLAERANVTASEFEELRRDALC